jgi:hypothetical protein
MDSFNVDAGMLLADKRNAAPFGLLRFVMSDMNLHGQLDDAGRLLLAGICNALPD